MNTTTGRLRRCIRPSLGVLGAQRGTLGASAGVETFVMRILLRHANERGAVVPVDAALRADPEWNSTTVFEMIEALSVHSAFFAQIAATIEWRPSGTPTARSPGAGRALLERIFRREHRVERLPSAANQASPSPAPALEPRAAHPQFASDRPSPAGAALAARAYPPSAPALVVRRVPGSAEATRTRTPPESTGPSPLREIPASATPRAAPSVAASNAFSPSDVARLTEEVVRAIDRRIIAQRERKGVL